MFKVLTEYMPDLGFISNETLLLIVTVILLLWLHVKRRWGYFKRQDMPYVIPTVRGMGTLLPSLTQAFEYDLLNRKKLGPIYGEFSMLTPRMTVHDTDIIRQIYVKQFHNFPCRMLLFTKSKGKELNTGVDQVIGRQWKRIRSSMTPIFSSGKLRLMHGIMNECGNEMMAVLHKKVLHENGKLDCREIFGRYSLNVLLLSAFNISICNQVGEEPEIVKQAKILLDIKITNNPLLLLILLFPSLENITSKFNMSFLNKNAVAYFNNLSKAIMKRRRENPTDEKVDIMQLMLEIQKTENEVNDSNFTGKGMTETEIIGNAMLMVIAGYDNVANQIMYLAYNLAMHPEEQDKLIEEIDQHADDNGDASYKLINEMHFLEMCVNESSRLYPALIRIPRTCTKDTIINGVQFKKNMVINIPAFALHHDPDYWTKPFEFRPERMLDMAKIDPMMFQPFGQGPRNCIAMRFAKVQVKVAIIKVLSKYRILPGPDTPKPPLELLMSSTIKPKIPIFLKIKQK